MHRRRTHRRWIRNAAVSGLIRRNRPLPRRVRRRRQRIVPPDQRRRRLQFRNLRERHHARLSIYVPSVQIFLALRRRVRRRELHRAAPFALSGRLVREKRQRLHAAEFAQDRLQLRVRGPPRERGDVDRGRAAVVRDVRRGRPRRRRRRLDRRRRRARRRRRRRRRRRSRRRVVVWVVRNARVVVSRSASGLSRGARVERARKFERENSVSTRAARSRRRSRRARTDVAVKQRVLVYVIVRGRHRGRAARADARRRGDLRRASRRTARGNGDEANSEESALRRHSNGDKSMETWIEIS